MLTCLAGVRDSRQQPKGVIIDKNTGYLMFSELILFGFTFCVLSVDLLDYIELINKVLVGYFRSGLIG